MLTGARISTQSALVFLLSALLFWVPAWSGGAVGNPWHVWKQSEALKVSYRRSRWDKLIEIKAEARVRSSLSGFLLFILDTDNAPKWLYNAVSTKVIRQFSPYENIFVTTLKSFGPVKARDMVIRSEFWQNDDLSLEILNQDAAAEVLPQAQTIRMSVKTARWHVIPDGERSITIKYRFVVDAKGNLPSWLSRPIALFGIWQTMSNLSEQLPTSDWQKHIYAGINEAGGNR